MCIFIAHSPHVETVCLLSKLHEAKHHVNVTLEMDELDVTATESKATYEEIKEYVRERHGIVPYAIRRLDYRDFENYCKNMECKDDKSGFVPDSTFFCLDEERNIMVGAVESKLGESSA